MGRQYMFWINLGLSLVGGVIAVSIGYLVVKKPREKLVAFIIVVGLCSIPLAILHQWIIKPAIKTWFNQKEMRKRLMEAPSYKEVNKQDIEAAHECFYNGQYEKAAEYYQKALGSASESKAELNYRIGLSYYMAGNFNEVREYWDTAKKQNPDIFKLRTFYIPSENMAPTLIIGDYVIGDIEYYRHRTPSRGDVIFFINPQQKEKIFVGRIIGMPDEVIQIKGKETFINNSIFSDRYANFESPRALEKPFPETPPTVYLGPEKVPKES
jgi:signal peptidase I